MRRPISDAPCCEARIIESMSPSSISIAFSRFLRGVSCGSSRNTPQRTGGMALAKAENSS